MANEPLIGAFPATLSQNLVCLCHLLACITIIANLDGRKDMPVAGVDVSPTAQWMNGTFFAIGIVIVIAAGVGMLYRIESHLSAYFAYLSATLCVEVLWFAVFCIYGQGCRTHYPKYASDNVAQDFTATVSCGFTNGAFIVWMTILMLFTVFAMAVTFRARQFVRSVANMALLPYMKSHLEGDIAEKEAEKESWSASRSARMISNRSMPAQPTMMYGSVPATMGASVVQGGSVVMGGSPRGGSLTMPIAQPVMMSAPAVAFAAPAPVSSSMFVPEMTQMRAQSLPPQGGGERICSDGTVRPVVAQVAHAPHPLGTNRPAGSSSVLIQ